MKDFPQARLLALASFRLDQLQREGDVWFFDIQKAKNAKASYESNPLNTRSQSPRDADIFDLLINTETDLIYAITGTSTEPLFGSHVTGRDALTISPEITLDDLPTVLAEAFRRYERGLPERFAWVEDLRREKNSDTLQILDMELSSILQANHLPDNVWLGEPEIVDWESQIGYSFDLRERTLIHKTLQLTTLLEYMVASTTQFHTDVSVSPSIRWTLLCNILAVRGYKSTWNTGPDFSPMNTVCYGHRFDRNVANCARNKLHKSSKWTITTKSKGQNCLVREWVRSAETRHD
ncbi:DUF6119 family protein [Burkholderia multivorans]|nr:DUF6119 family protein [Burkholderia multivorans]